MIRLFELRTEKEISQRAIAQIMSVSQGTYNNWENGKTQPSIEQIITLANYFGVTVDYLIGNTNDYEVLSSAELLTEEQKEILNKVSRLSKSARNALMQFLDNI